MKKIVWSTRPLCLGNDINAPHLVVGKNEIDDQFLTGWFIQDLVNAGHIRIEDLKQKEPIDESKLVEVEIGETEIKETKPQEDAPELEMSAMIDVFKPPVTSKEPKKVSKKELVPAPAIPPVNVSEVPVKSKKVFKRTK